MPQGMDPLPQSDINLIRSWILDGAPPGGTVVPDANADRASRPTADRDGDADQSPRRRSTPAHRYRDGHRQRRRRHRPRPTRRPITETPHGLTESEPDPDAEPLRRRFKRRSSTSPASRCSVTTPLGMSGGLVLDRRAVVRQPGQRPAAEHARAASAGCCASTPSTPTTASSSSRSTTRPIRPRACACRPASRRSRPTRSSSSSSGSPRAPSPVAARHQGAVRLGHGARAYVGAGVTPAGRRAAPPRRRVQARRATTFRTCLPYSTSTTADVARHRRQDVERGAPRW